MPHLTLEYSDNIGEFDIQSLFERLHQALVATGAINLKGIKSRAICHSQYRIADGDPAYAFAHIGLLIRAGRPLETQQEAARRLMAVLQDAFGRRFESGYLSLSVDIQELREGIYQVQHNIPDKGAT